MTTPEVGVYEGVTEGEYFSWPCLSNSAMGLLAISPRHYKAGRPAEESKPFRFGSLTHCGWLETLNLAERYAVMPDYHLEPDNVTAAGVPTQSKATAVVKAKVAAFEQANADKTIVSREEYAAMKEAVESLRGDPSAVECLGGDGPIEVSLVWDDPETGLRCKARIDKLNHTQQRLNDLKTCRDLRKFRRSIAEYGYARQMAHYQDGWAVLSGELYQPWLIPVEKFPPYCTAAAPIGADTLAAGMAERDRLKRLLRDCLDKDEWPGPEVPDAWEAPEWYLNSEPVALTVGGVTVEL